MAAKPFVVGLGGTLRAGSLSECALRTCLAEVGRLGADTALFTGAQLDLPAYGSGLPCPPRVSTMLGALHCCDGVIVASPSYHGGISGLLKNALDYLEDLRTAENAYLDGKAVGCIVCAYGWQAVGTTLTALRAVAHALRAWPTPMGAGLNGTIPLFARDGTCLDESAGFQLALVARQVVDFANWRTCAREAACCPPDPMLLRRNDHAT